MARELHTPEEQAKATPSDVIDPPRDIFGAPVNGPQKPPHLDNLSFDSFYSLAEHLSPRDLLSLSLVSKELNLRVKKFLTHAVYFFDRWALPETAKKRLANADVLFTELAKLEPEALAQFVQSHEWMAKHFCDLIGKEEKQSPARYAICALVTDNINELDPKKLKAALDELEKTYPNSPVIFTLRVMECFRINDPSSCKLLEIPRQNKYYLNLSGTNVRVLVPGVIGLKDYLRNLLRGFNLISPKLKNTDFFDLDLSQCELIGADLRGCNLVGTNLYQAVLINANINGARFASLDGEYHASFGPSFFSELGETSDKSLKAQVAALLRSNLKLEVIGNMIVRPVVSGINPSKDGFLAFREPKELEAFNRLFQFGLPIRTLLGEAFQYTIGYNGKAFSPADYIKKCQKKMPHISIDDIMVGLIYCNSASFKSIYIQEKEQFGKHLALFDSFKNQCELETSQKFVACIKWLVGEDNPHISHIENAKGQALSEKTKVEELSPRKKKLLNTLIFAFFEDIKIDIEMLKNFIDRCVEAGFNPKLIVSETESLVRKSVRHNEIEKTRLLEFLSKHPVASELDNSCIKVQQLMKTKIYVFLEDIKFDPIMLKSFIESCEKVGFHPKFILSEILRLVNESSHHEDPEKSKLREFLLDHPVASKHQNLVKQGVNILCSLFGKRGILTGRQELINSHNGSELKK